MQEVDEIGNSFAKELKDGNFYTGHICRNCLDYMEDVGHDSEDIESRFDSESLAQVENTFANYAVFISHLHNNDFDSRCWHNDSCEDRKKQYNHESCCDSDDAKSFFNVMRCFSCEEIHGGDYWQVTAFESVRSFI